MIGVALWTKAWALQVGLKLQFDENTKSTNASAKDDQSPITKPVLTSGFVSAPTLYLTTSQSQGRGRGANSWTTAEDALLSTWSYATSFPPQPILAPLVGLALFEAASTAFPEVAFNLKAPNDLYIGDRKAAGLLIESVLIGTEVTCAIGLGFNVANAPEDLAKSATHLCAHLRSPLTEEAWTRFLNLWSEKLAQAVKDSRSDMLRSDIRARLVAALNLHPLLAEPILEVDEFAQLLTPSGRIYWHQL